MESIPDNGYENPMVGMPMDDQHDDDFSGDDPDDQEDMQDDRPPRPPRRKRGRPPKKKTYGNMAEKFPGLAELDLDEWGQRFNWNLPKIKMTLRREVPTHYQGVKTAGHLDEQPLPYTMAVIKQKWGGGDYVAKVIGQLDESDPRVRPLALKRFSIAGPPIVDNPDSLPSDVKAGIAQGTIKMNPRRSSGEGDGLDATKGLLDIVEGEVEMLRQKVHGADGRAAEGMQQMRATYLDAMKVVKDSAESRATARESAAQEQARVARDWAAQERSERERLQERLANMEREVSDKIRSTQGESLNLVATLLPNLTQSTQEQVRVLAAQYEAREERLAAQHQASINQLTQVHQIQLQTVQGNYEGQLRNLESSHNNNMSLAKAQLQTLQAEKEQIQRQLEDVRRALDDSRKELLSRIMGEKPKGTMDQLTELASTVEIIRSLGGSLGGGGGGGSDDGIGDGVDNPMMKSFMKLTERALPVIGEALASRRQPAVQMAPPPMMPTVYQPPPPAAPPRTQAPAPQPAGTRISKSDLLEAFTFLDAVLSQPEPPSPEDVAQAAMGKADNAMLRELARRDPEKLLATFEREKLLPGNLATPEGKDYLRRVLDALRSLLT